MNEKISILLDLKLLKMWNTILKILYLNQRENIFFSRKHFRIIENHRDENFDINSPVGIIGTQYMRLNNLV